MLICSCAGGLSLALNFLVKNTQISTDSDCTFFFFILTQLLIVMAEPQLSWINVFQLSSEKLQ